MTKFDFLYKRVFDRVFGCYRTLYNHLQPFLVKKGDSFSVSRFQIEGFGGVSFEFKCNSSDWSWSDVTLVKSI